MSSPSRQEFFDHVEQLLKQEVSTPGDFLLPLFYLHLLCLPAPHWVTADLLHFWNADSWQVAFQAPETKAAVVQQLKRYPLLIQRLRGLLLYFLAERNVPELHIPKERERQIRRVKGNFEDGEWCGISTNVKGFTPRSKFR